MPRTRLSFDTARDIARELPGVEESTAYGSPALKVGGKLMACIPTHRSADPDSLAVSVDFMRREELLAEAPEIYYAPEHYVNYPIVLVRLSRIRREALEGLLRGAWTFATAKKKSARRPR
jgi:hypothetical protein